MCKSCPHNYQIGPGSTQKASKTARIEAARPLRKELEKIDAKMQALNSEKSSLQTLLTSTKVPAEIAQTGKRLKAIDTELGTLEERWLELTEQIESVAV